MELIPGSDETTNTLEAVLLFFNNGPWTEEDRLAWFNRTGSNECTNKVLCDQVRKALKTREEQHVALEEIWKLTHQYKKPEGQNIDFGYTNCYTLTLEEFIDNQFSLIKKLGDLAQNAL